jgi:hypothetical protein
LEVKVIEMNKSHIPGTWEAKLDCKVWKIFDENSQLIATLAKSSDAETKARIIAISPYMLEALKGVVGLLRDEDLPDNGEYNGGAVSDMVRSAVELSSK